MLFKGGHNDKFWVEEGKSLMCGQIPCYKRKSYTSILQLLLPLNTKLFCYSIEEVRNYFVSFIQIIYSVNVKSTAKWFLLMWYIQIVNSLTFAWSSPLEGIPIKYHNSALSSLEKINSGPDTGTLTPFLLSSHASSSSYALLAQSTAVLRPS